MLIRGRFGRGGGGGDRQMKKETRKFGTIYYVRRKQGMKDAGCVCGERLCCVIKSDIELHVKWSDKLANKLIKIVV
jgi:hypothetical protein